MRLIRTGLSDAALSVELDGEHLNEILLVIFSFGEFTYDTLYCFERTESTLESRDRSDGFAGQMKTAHHARPESLISCDAESPDPGRRFLFLANEVIYSPTRSLR